MRGVWVRVCVCGCVCVCLCVSIIIVYVLNGFEVFDNQGMFTINFEPPIKTRFVWLRAQYALDLRWVRLWLLSAGYIRNQEFYIPVYLKLDIHRVRLSLCFSARDIYIRVFTDLRHLMIDIQQVRTWILFLLEIYCIFFSFSFHSHQKGGKHRERRYYGKL